jgi:hypothetical protein
MKLTSSLILVSGLLVGCASGGVGPLESSATGFSPFPLEGGYSPGGIVSLDKRQRVTGLLVSRERINQVLDDPSVLALGESTSSPETALNRKREFTLGIAANSVPSLSDADASVSFRDVKDVNLTTTVATRQPLKAGGVALEDALAAMPCTDLKRVSAAIREGNRSVFLTEVLIYEKATAIFKWSKEVNTKAQAAIASKLGGLGGAVTWTDNSHLTVSYNKPVIVGHKGRAISARKVDNAQLVACAKPPVTVSSLEVEWHTGEDGKDWNTQPEVHLFDGSGREVASIRCCSSAKRNGDEWPKGSTNSRAMTLVASPLTLDDLTHGRVQATRNPIGNDDWDYTVTVRAILSNGKRPTIVSCSGRNSCSIGF